MAVRGGHRYNGAAMNEERLIEKSKAGDIRAFEQLIKPYEGRLFTYLTKMCNDPDAAKDMIQETFLNVFKKIGSYEHKAKFSTWLFQVAINNCLMLKRRHASHSVISLDDHEHPLPYDIIDQKADLEHSRSRKELKDLVDRALQQLDPPYRSVFMLSEVDGFTAIEISTILKLTLPNVKARIRRAKEKLRTMLTPELLAQCCTCQSIPRNAHKQIIECIKNYQRA